MTLIAFHDVHAAYPGASAEAIRGITFTIDAGEHVCLLGSNGSGKSTLLQLINGLITPRAGDVRVAGRPTTDLERAMDIRSKTASVFQQPEDQMVTSIVADDVAFGPENLCMPQPEIARRVGASLAAVNMASHAQSDPADLSGGQVQRVAFAGALAMSPQILLLDEPCAMLDGQGRADVRRIIGELSEQGMTIVHVTHFMEDALAAGRVIVLKQGLVAFDGQPSDLFSQPDLVAALGLEEPRAQGSVLADAAHDTEGLGDEVHRGLEMPPADGGPYVGVGPHATGRPQAASGPRATGAPRADDKNPTSIVFDDVSFSYATARNPRRRTRASRLGKLFARRTGKSPDRAPSQAGFGEARENHAAPKPHEGAGTQTLQHISFSAHPGTLTALIGRTGSGKSTTAELACALKLPSSGTVRVRSIDTCDFERRRELRHHVGYVAQLPERQLFAETVYDDVAFGPRNLGLDETEVEHRVREALASVNLDPTDELLARSPFALSGGQQRSVALAGVLAMRQSVLVLDEPMAGLDPQGRANLRGLLRKLKSEGVTLLMVTHSMEDVSALADQVIELDSGRIVRTGRSEEVACHGDSR